MTDEPVVAVIGEALVDLLPAGTPGEYRARPGGSPFNVAVGLARLGNRTSLMARFADDRYGRLLRNAAAAEGVDLRGAPRAAERASVAIASFDAAARATYRFDIEGTADWQWTSAELRGLRPDMRSSPGGVHDASEPKWSTSVGQKSSVGTGSRQITQEG